MPSIHCLHLSEGNSIKRPLSSFLPRLLLLIIFFFNTRNASSQIGPNIDWQVCLGGSSNEYSPRIRKTPDKGFIFLSSTNSISGDIQGNHGNYDGWLTKLDSNGVLQWQHCYGGSAADYTSDVIISNGGGYILAIYANSTNGQVQGSHGGSEIWVVRIDTVGNILWQHPLGGSSSEIPGGIMELPDSTIMVCGYTLSNDGNVTGNHGNGDVWVVKLRKDGSIIWQKCFGGSQSDYANNLLYLGNGNCLVAGYTYSNNNDVSGNHGGQDAWAFEIDTAANLIWQHCYGGSDNEAFTQLREFNSVIYLAGTTKSIDGDVTGNHGLEDYWLVKTDQASNIIKQKCFGGSSVDVLTSISLKPLNGMVLCGESLSNDGDVIGNHNPGTNDGWLMRIDSAFNLLWSRCYGGTGVDFGFKVIADDNRLLIGGGTNSTDGDVSCTYHGLLDLWIFETGKECEVPVSASFSYEQNGLSFGFHDLSNEADSWLWDFGDGNTSSEKSPEHEYAQPGIYTVCLGVTDSCGYDTTCAIINTCGWASAGFGFDQINLEFSFHDSSGLATEWHWDFGDGQTSTEQNPQHVYDQPGIYTVKQVAANECNSDSITQVINTCGPLQGGFTCTILQLLANFTDTSSSNANAWFWTFGDGLNSSQQNPAHVYSQPGTYSVVLKVSTDCESKYLSKTITVCATAKADFSFVINGADVVFENNSVYGTSYLWNFGNGATSTLISPSYFFTDSGMYNICLTAQNVCNADDTCIIFHNTYLGNASLCWNETYSESSATDHTANAVFADDENNVILIGSSGKGSGTLLYKNAFVLRYSPDGNLLWHKNLADSYPDDYFLPVASCHDAAGNIFLLFTWQQAPSLINNWGLVKFNSEGAQQWVVPGEITLNERGAAIACDADGNVVVAGYTIGTTFTGDYLIEKIDSGGNTVWKKSWDYLGYSDAASDIVISPQGNIVVTGTAIADYLDEHEKMATVIYDEDGNFQSAFSEGNDITIGKKVVTNKSGDAWVLGESSYFGEDPFTYVQRIGSVSWLTSYAGSVNGEEDVTPVSIAVDSSGFAYAAVQVDYKDANNTEHYYPILLKLDPQGVPVWEKEIPGIYESEGLTAGFVLRSVVTNEAGKSFYTGYSKPAGEPSSSLNVITGRINSAGSTDWLDSFDHAELADYGISVALDKSGNILIGGRTDSDSSLSELLTLKYCIQCTTVPVTFSLYEDTFCLGSSGIPLEGGNPPGGAYSGDGVLDGIFYPDSAGPGVHQIIYAISDDDQCVSADTLPVFVDVCTGIEQLNGISFGVSPNPFFASTNLHFHLNQKAFCRIEVTDARGKQVAVLAEKEFLAGDYLIPWNREQIAAGVYFLHLHGNTFSVTTKVVAE